MMIYTVVLCTLQDLAEGHLKAMSFMNSSEPGFFTHNLGTGRGYSVKEMVTVSLLNVLHSYQ
jgi:UDP-glucose 4-epimerase